METRQKAQTRPLQVCAVPAEPAGGRGLRRAVGRVSGSATGSTFRNGACWRRSASATSACSAQYIAHCTRTHKSTISRAVTALMERQLVERVENADDRREFALRMTRKGKALYEELIPRLLRREQEILSCLSAQERKDFAACWARSRTASIWCRRRRKRASRTRIEGRQCIRHARSASDATRSLRRPGDPVFQRRSDRAETAL